MEDKNNKKAEEKARNRISDASSGMNASNIPDIIVTKEIFRDLVKSKGRRLDAPLLWEKLK